MFDKKATKSFFLGTLACIVLAIILLCCLKYCFKTLMEDILVSIITGCIFSGIGVLAFIITSSRDARKKLDDLLEKIHKLLESYQNSIGIEGQTALLNETKGRLVQAYYDLILLQNRNFTRKSNTYNSLIDHLFELCIKSSSANSEEPQIRDIRRIITTCIGEVDSLTSSSKS